MIQSSLSFICPNPTNHEFTKGGAIDIGLASEQLRLGSGTTAAIASGWP